MKLVKKNKRNSFQWLHSTPTLYYLYFCTTVFVQPALAFPFFFPFRLLFLSFFLSALVGEPRVSSGRFSVSFPFEPASNLTAAVSAVFPGSSVAFLFVSAFSFSSPFPVSCSFLLSFSAPLRRPAGLVGTVFGEFSF